MSQVTRYSADAVKNADKKLETYILDLPRQVSHHRVESQKIKCNFGLQGVCCRLCANGPCRISPDSPLGICGANADAIVVRNFLRMVSAGSGCYIHIVENAAFDLKNMAEKGLPFKGENTLHRLCETFEIYETDPHVKAGMLADLVLSDLYKPQHEKMVLVEKLANPKRYQRWADLNILPSGSKSEVFNGVVKTSTNLNSDPVDMLLDCLKLGISTGLYGLTLTNYLNDIMLGEPVIRVAPVGFRVIDPDYINIMITGHQHSKFAHLQDRIIEAAVVEKAQQVGAKGFRLVGCTCVGQDLQLRGAHYQEVFAGHVGNNFTQEAILSTGAIDMVLSEFNCTMPGIEPICDELKIKQICLDNVAKKANADLMERPYSEVEALSADIIHEAISAYAKRRPQVALNLLDDHGNDETFTGFSETNLKEFFGGTWQPLIDLILSGKIKGVAAILGCSSLMSGGHDVLTVEMAEEFIKRDILVLSAGCCTGGIENVGLMTKEAAKLAGPNLREVCEKLGIPPVLNFGPCLAIGRIELVVSQLATALNLDIPDLPVVLSAPQWLEEQSLADGCFGLALGLPLHLGVPPFITGSPIAVEVLTESMKKLTGGQVVLGEDSKIAADKLEAIILEKRAALNI